MNEVWLYSIGSAILISLISLIGVFFLSFKEEQLRKILLYLVSFSAGALLGGAFLHLIPEIVEEAGFGMETALYLLLGIGLFFIVEKFIRWRHCHIPTSKRHPHPFALMNLVGDGVHNFIDGLIIAVSYLVSIPVGIATTFAVAFHEIPQEIGDFGVLLHGGFTRKKALLMNFLTALMAVFGAIIALVLNEYVDGIINVLVPLAAGGFIYIAGTDLIPELQKEQDLRKSFVQLIFLILGVFVMYLMKILFEA